MLNYSKKTGYFLSNINKLKKIKNAVITLIKTGCNNIGFCRPKNNAETTLKMCSHSWTRTNDPEMTNLNKNAEIILYRLHIRTLTN